MPDRVAIVQHGFIPEFRVRLYELLQEQGDIEYVIFHGQAPEGDRAAEGPFSFPNVRVTNRELRLGSKLVVYQPIVRKIVQGNFDALVLGTQQRLLANTPLFLMSRTRGRPVLLWGHGSDRAELTGRLLSAASGIASKLRQSAARKANGYLVYTDAGKEELIRNGVAPDRIAVLRNTLDIEQELQLHRQLMDANSGELRSALGLRANSVVLLYLGRVYAEKRVDDLCDLSRGLQDRGLSGDQVEIAVVGNGPGLEPVRRQAEDLDGLHLIGELRDPEAVARYLRVSAGVVMPGKVGLVVNHALAHGVPVITRESDLHSVEIEYVEPDINGLIVKGDFEAFVDNVAAFVNSPGLQRRLSSGALSTRRAISLESMAETFHAAVSRALAQRREEANRNASTRPSQESATFDSNQESAEEARDRRSAQV